MLDTKATKSKKFHINLLIIKRKIMVFLLFFSEFSNHQAIENDKHDSNLPFFL